MGAELKITDAETLKLAQSVAHARGETIEATIRAALEREQLALTAQRERKIADNIAAMREIARQFRERMPPEWHHMTSKEIMDSVYDENGLPIR